jgi:hypothetical protein
LRLKAPSSLTQTTSNFKDIKIDQLTPREKEEVNKDFYKTYTNNIENNLLFNSERNFPKVQQILNHNEIHEIPANFDKEKISPSHLTPNSDKNLMSDSHLRFVDEISNLKKETQSSNKVNSSNRYNSNKSDKNANVLNMSQSYNSNKSNHCKLIETIPKESEKKVQPKSYITINPTTGPSNKSSYGQIYKGKTVSKVEALNNKNQWSKTMGLDENKKTEFIRINSFGGERESGTNTSKISNFSNSNFYIPLNFSKTDKFDKFENLDPNLSQTNNTIIQPIEKPMTKSALRALKKTETKESKDEDTQKLQINNPVKTIPIHIKPHIINENLNMNNFNLNESFSDQQRVPQIYSRPSTKSSLNTNYKNQIAFSDNSMEPGFDDNKINLNIINNIANTNNINNISDPLSTNYDHLINLLERYREMNDKLMSCLNREDLTVKIDTERRKQDVENLEQILEYINSIKNLPDKNEQEHVIPFYLIDKRRLYENIVNYIYHTKDRVGNNIPTNSKSFKSLSFKK